MFVGLLLPRILEGLLAAAMPNIVFAIRHQSFDSVGRCEGHYSEMALYLRLRLMICRYWLLRDVRSAATPRDVTQCLSFSHVLLSPVLGGFPLAVAARSAIVPNLRISSLQSMFHRLPQR